MQNTASKGVLSRWVQSTENMMQHVVEVKTLNIDRLKQQQICHAAVMLSMTFVFVEGEL